MRFNRTRLRGGTGLVDNAVALNTLFESLYTLGVALVSLSARSLDYYLTCILQSLFTPFTMDDIAELLPFAASGQCNPGIRPPCDLASRSGISL